MRDRKSWPTPRCQRCLQYSSREPPPKLTREARSPSMIDCATTNIHRQRRPKRERGLVPAVAHAVGSRMMVVDAPVNRFCRQGCHRGRPPCHPVRLLYLLRFRARGSSARGNLRGPPTSTTATPAMELTHLQVGVIFLRHAVAAVGHRRRR